MALPHLTTLGTAKADKVCQLVIANTKPTPGPAARDMKLDTLGVPDSSAIVILVNQLVATTKVHGATLDPATLNGLAPGTTFGAMEDIVAAAPRDKSA
jgi:hypothetical protein